jgi:hypothetical protein
MIEIDLRTISVGKKRKIRNMKNAIRLHGGSKKSRIGNIAFRLLLVLPKEGEQPWLYQI